jgi:hypothetical protein
MLARGSKVISTTDCISLTGENPMRDPRTGVDFFGTLGLSVVEEREVRLALTARRALETLDFAAPRKLFAWPSRLRGATEGVFYLAQKVPVAGRIAAKVLGKGSYLRWVADCRLELPGSDMVETGQGLYEIMSFS